MVRITFDDVLHWQPVDMVMREQQELDAWMVEKLLLITDRVAAGEPLQYVTGVARFHGLQFHVTPAVLIPRPETEQLVDLIVDENKRDDLRILDLGTGSGCIAIALARALKWPQVTALDVSGDALAVARENAAALKARVTFKQADMLALKGGSLGEWDVIVSNPPYVCRSEAATMETHVKDYEPEGALFVPDDNPLLFYRAIASFAASSLAPQGRVYVEVNSRFATQVAALFERSGLSQVAVYNDFAALPRFVTAVLER